MRFDLFGNAAMKIKYNNAFMATYDEDPFGRVIFHIFAKELHLKIFIFMTQYHCSASIEWIGVGNDTGGNFSDVKLRWNIIYALAW